MELEELRSRAAQHGNMLKEAEARAAKAEEELASAKRHYADAMAAASDRVRAAEAEASRAREAAQVAQDAAKIKEKMVDSANATVQDLKDALEDLQMQLAEDQKQQSVRPSPSVHDARQSEALHAKGRQDPPESDRRFQPESGRFSWYLWVFDGRDSRAAVRRIGSKGALDCCVRVNWRSTGRKPQAETGRGGRTRVKRLGE